MLHRDFAKEQHGADRSSVRELFAVVLLSIAAAGTVVVVATSR